MDPKEFVAEDTVMNEKEIAQAYQKGRDEADSPIDEGAAWKVIAKAQAEISFKAGMEHGDKKAYECGVYNGEAEGLAKGIKEVVDWIKKYRSESTREFICLTFSREGFESKLKEWGLQ